jgi:hypothetical protein
MARTTDYRSNVTNSRHNVNEIFGGPGRERTDDLPGEARARLEWTIQPANQFLNGAVQLPAF